MPSLPNVPTIAEGGDIIADTPDEFGKFIRCEIAKWSKAVKESGAKVD